MSPRSISGVAGAHLVLVSRSPAVALAALAALSVPAALILTPASTMSDVARGITLGSLLLPLLAVAGYWRSRNTTPLHRLLMAQGWPTSRLAAVASLSRLLPALMVVLAVRTAVPGPDGGTPLQFALFLGLAWQLAGIGVLLGAFLGESGNVVTALVITGLLVMFSLRAYPPPQTPPTAVLTVIGAFCPLQWIVWLGRSWGAAAALWSSGFLLLLLGILLAPRRGE